MIEHPKCRQLLVIVLVLVNSNLDVEGADK